MNLTTQGTLSRLLATENITVQHGNYSTAFFDVEARVLGLPNWQNKGKDIYDLLCGHEVGHALFTPVDGLKNHTRGARKDYLNLVEDARIEKMIQKQYPGLISCFQRGYAALHAEDFFGIKNRPVDSLNFPDRLNIKFKLRNLADINFTIEEQRIFNLIENAQTWDEVVDAALELERYVKAAKPQDDQGKQETFPAQAASQNSEMDPTSSQSEEQSADSQDSNETDASDDSDSKSEEQNNSDDGLEKDSADDDDAEGEPKDSKANSDESDAEKQDDDLSDADETAVPPSFDPSANADTTDEVVTTQRNFENAISDKLIDRSKNTLDTSFPVAPTKKECMENIFPFSELQNLRNISLTYTTFANSALMQSEYREYIKSQRKVISMMAKEFEMRKAAYQYSRATVTKTGSLNLERLHAYRTSDDLFLSVTRLANAKNHGLVMFVDYSGSMGCILRDVLRHIINMALFCRQVGIPFNVYAFTSDTTPRAASKSVPYYLGQNEVYSQDKILVSNTVLFDLVNSELSKADFNTALFSLWLRSKDDSARAACENLGNTPLNETLIIAHEIINQFRAKHNPDKVTTLFLTDGEGHALKIGMSSVLNDVRITSNKNDLSWNTGRLTSFKLNGRQVRAATWGNCESTEQAMTPALIENLRITTGAEVIGFYIPATRSRLQSNALEALRYTKHKLSTYAAWTSQYEKIYKQDDMVSIPGAFNYSNYFIIAGSDISTDDEELEVTPDMTRNRIARAFKNYSASKKANRIFVSKFAEAIA